MPSFARLLLLVVTVPFLHGCYLLQAAQGQMQIASKREPIETVLRRDSTPEQTRKRLEYASAARDFASHELHLPDNASYRSYADLGRDSVVWNVFATREFSVEPKRWCFPIVGCVVYRGYFKEASARRYALHLRMRGYDAMVGGVPAYSTLGHFNDPILNTMMGWSDAQLAATLFHELAHQLIYVPGDSQFNETFATAVEEVGLERWLVSIGQPQQLVAWRKYQDRQEQFIQLLLRTRDRLRTLYASNLPEEQMRARKQTIFGELKFEYTTLRASWNGYAGYDRWFDRALNNAHLVSAATYHGCLPGFMRILDSVGGDLPRFYDEVRRISKLAQEERTAVVCGDDQERGITTKNTKTTK